MTKNYIVDDKKLKLYNESINLALELNNLLGPEERDADTPLAKATRNAFRRAQRRYDKLYGVSDG